MGSLNNPINLDSPEENLKKKKPVVPPKPPRKETELLIDPEITTSRRRRPINLPYRYKIRDALREDDPTLEITESALLEKLAERIAFSSINSIISIVGITGKEALTHLKKRDMIGDWLRYSYHEVKLETAQRIEKLAELVSAFH